jgi:hypothetical protein
MKRRARRVAVTAVSAVAVASTYAYVARPGRDVADGRPATVEAPVGRVKVEVLNVGGVSGMASRATETLRAAGFDVVDFRNADAFDADTPSRVIDRVGRTDLARAVADALGIDNVLSEPSANLFVDVSVLVGSEWGGARRGPDDGAVGRAWWDPRGWIGR